MLETDLPKLEKLLRKGKNVTKTVMDDRMAKVCQLCSSYASNVCSTAGQAGTFGGPHVATCHSSCFHLVHWSCRSSRSEMALQTFLMVSMGPANLQGYAPPPMLSITISMQCGHSVRSGVHVKRSMCLMSCYYRPLPSQSCQLELPYSMCVAVGWGRANSSRCNSQHRAVRAGCSSHKQSWLLPAFC